VDTEEFSHTEPFTQRSLYKEELLHRNFYTLTQKLLRYTKKSLQRGAFTQGRLYTQKLLPTEAFTHRSFDTEELFEGSLEVKLPTIWTDEKQRWEESGKSSAEERRSEKKKVQKKEDAGSRQGRKFAKHCVFPMCCGSGGSKSRLGGCGAICGDEK